MSTAGRRLSSRPRAISPAGNAEFDKLLIDCKLPSFGRRSRARDLAQMRESLAGVLAKIEAFLRDATGFDSHALAQGNIGHD